jgi:hypothetical protein
MARLLATRLGTINGHQIWLQPLAKQINGAALQKEANLLYVSLQLCENVHDQTLALFAYECASKVCCIVVMSALYSKLHALPDQSLLDLFRKLSENLDKRPIVYECEESGQLIFRESTPLAPTLISRLAAIDWKTVVVRFMINDPYISNAAFKGRVRVCQHCHSLGDTFMRCGHCCAVYYCSKEHQHTDWNIHRTVCATLKTEKKEIKKQHVPFALAAVE